MKKVILFTVLVVVSNGLAQTKTIFVPQDYVSIQGAIDAAQNSDTIVVSEGTFYENINFKGKGIVLTSRFYITQDWQTVLKTIIDGSQAADKNNASVVQLLSHEDSSAILDGFTITGGKGSKYLFGSNPWQEGGGIILSYSSAVVRNNFICYNTTVPQGATTDGGGGGIASMYGNPKIYNNVIFANQSGYAGGIVLNWSNGTIRNNIVYHNSSVTSVGTGGIMLWRTPAGTTVIENNTVVGNASASDAGGINIHPDNASIIPIVRNNVVWGNQQVSGSQVANPQYGSYNNIEDYQSGTNISVYPEFQEGSFLLSATSPCIDSGDPTSGGDPEDPANSGLALLPSRGSLRNDIGAYGGSLAKALPAIDTIDLHFSKDTLILRCPPGQHATGAIRIANRGTKHIRIDSVAQSNPRYFELISNLTGKEIGLFASDTVSITFSQAARGFSYDTVMIFHSEAGLTNPIRVLVTGASNSIPFKNKAFPAQTGYVGQLLSFRIPDSTFLDGDAGDVLTYRANGLPGWLTFDSLSLTFQGTPTTPTGRLPLSITVTVEDLLQATASTRFNVTVLPTTGVGVVDEVPMKFALMQNYPNPFNPSCTIRFQIPSASRVTLRVMDVLGRTVAVLIDREMNAGTYSEEFYGVNLASGTYFYRLRAGDFVETRKMVILK